MSEGAAAGRDCAGEGEGEGAADRKDEVWASSAARPDVVVTDAPFAAGWRPWERAGHRAYYGGQVVCESCDAAAVRRIVAMQTACRGVPVEALEALGPGGVLELIPVIAKLGRGMM